MSETTHIPDQTAAESAHGQLNSVLGHFGKLRYDEEAFWKTCNEMNLGPFPARNWMSQLQVGESRLEDIAVVLSADLPSTPLIQLLKLYAARIEKLDAKSAA